MLLMLGNGESDVGPGFRIRDGIQPSRETWFMGQRNEHILCRHGCLTSKAVRHEPPEMMSNNSEFEHRCIISTKIELNSFFSQRDETVMRRRFGAHDDHAQYQNDNRTDLKHRCLPQDSLLDPAIHRGKEPKLRILHHSIAGNLNLAFPPVGSRGCYGAELSDLPGASTVEKGRNEYLCQMDKHWAVSNGVVER